LDTKCQHTGGIERVKKKHEKHRKIKVPGGGVGGTGTYLWGAGKTSDSGKSIAKHWGKRQSGNMA